MFVLCGFPLSNYYNKVKLALLEKGVPFTEEGVPTGAASRSWSSPRSSSRRSRATSCVA